MAAKGDSFREHDSTCRYVRQIDGGWEYGLVTKSDQGVNKHNPQGIKDTMEEALKCFGEF